MDGANSQDADGSIFRHSVYLDTGRLGAGSGERLFLREKEAACLLASHAAELHPGASGMPNGPHSRMNRTQPFRSRVARGCASASVLPFRPE